MNQENQERMMMLVMDVAFFKMIEQARGTPVTKAEQKKIYRLFSPLLSELRKKWRMVPDSQVSQLEDELNSTPALLKKAYLQLARALPRRPGGKPRKLNDLQRREVNDKIVLLQRRGQSLRAAQVETAKSFNVSLRTVQRAWKERSKV